MNTITLYENYWRNRPLSLIQRDYPEIVDELTNNQIAQYEYWLGLTNLQKDSLYQQISSSPTHEVTIVM